MKKTCLRISTHQPAQCGTRKLQRCGLHDPEVPPRNPENRFAGPHLADPCPAMVIPEAEKIALSQSFFRHSVIHHSVGSIPQAFTTGQKTSPKLRVFISDFASRTRTHIGSEATIFIKHLSSKRHVRPEGRTLQFLGIITLIEKSQHAADGIWAFKSEPRRRRDNL